MRVVITGAGGLLGYDLLRLGARLEQGLSVNGVAGGLHPVEVRAFVRTQLNVSDARQVYACLSEVRPDVVIHAAAYTKVDLAEREGKAEAFQTNSFGSAVLALACAQTGARLVYVSTDYVFDGEKRAPYLPTDTPHPINEYGRSKWLGERWICELTPHCDIVRTSWLYGGHPERRDFVRTMLAAARAQIAARRNGRARLAVVRDQVGSPTCCAELARAIWQLVLADTPTAPTIHHIAGAGACSWHEFACAIFTAAGLADRVQVEAVATADLQLPARRPRYSVLSQAGLADAGVSPLPHWRETLEAFLSPCLSMA
ncbi:MAG: dTDP-4-dehydrorhamnose reductase [Alicyclobacillus herbarius]|uniref:dTDP-4-dehydrorhamnose reductase n=1 Tax=Alicyclobacillus herbarius TaxID=122960 RepID=UPI0004053FAF|nr:dTDP-4-dehydrorhamnose reductase [Alicyclobacillus herbarius]MCL6632754.1 dTDP-4-dehydrorhamnose reductase [Alicyclobacillus herbarius]